MQRSLWVQQVQGLEVDVLGPFRGRSDDTAVAGTAGSLEECGQM